LSDAGQDEVSLDRGRVRWIVAGRVQGVGFRWHVVNLARRCGVCGDVRNLPDGRVEVRAVAEPARLGELLAGVRLGPSGARVDGVESGDLDPALSFEDFQVRF